jgi:long-chain acyl-CoA synthetase
VKTSARTSKTAAPQRSAADRVGHRPKLGGDRPWLAHYDPGVPAEVEIPPIPVDGLLRASALRAPDRTAMVFFGARTSYAQLDQAADRFAHVLRSMGVEKGDRVSLHLPTSPAFVIAFMGTMRAGALAVPMNPLYVERELGILLAETEPRVSVTVDLLVSRLHAVEVAAGPGRPGRLIVTGIQDSLPVPIRWLYPLKARREGRWHPQRHTPATPNLFRLLREAPAGRFESAATPENGAVLQPTGGTTGTPKAAMLTHRNLVANACQTAAWFPHAAKDDPAAILCPLPLFHIYGLTVAMNYAILTGGTLLLVPRFDPELVLKTAAKYRPRLFPGAPVMYETLAHHPDVGRFDLSSIEACISGAAPLPAGVQRDFEAITGGKVCEGYGLTEASPVTHCNPIDSGRRNGTIGLPFPSTDARVVEPRTGKPVATGKVGELEIAGPQVMAGYWHRPAETADVFHDGWLRTGDIARQDADGFFTIVDRAKDLIVVGGINVYPREVEEVLMNHPAVAEAAVIGMAHEHYGEVPCAFIVLAEGASATEEELFAYCHKNLARFKVPFAMRFRTRLPKTMIGKVLRKDLRGEASVSSELTASIKARSR